MFDGLRFTDENPYTYREAKRLIRLLGDLLQRRKDLHKIGVDQEGIRRSAITGKGSDAVWDFLPLKEARNSQFTAYPHMTMAISRSRAVAAVTVPNGIKGGFRKKLLSLGIDGFRSFIGEVERDLQPIVNRSKGAAPVMYITQRHYRTQSSPAVVDARLETDLRTSFPRKQSPVRYQPEWIEAIYNVFVNKRSNIQFGMEVQFSYSCPIVQSPKCANLFAESWKALSPLIEIAVKN